MKKINCVKIINEFFLLQLLSFTILFYFITAINIFTLWYLGGLYLIFLGLILFLKNGGIFIGFLWIIDLGVGLIFFIFILHFSNFLYQKTFFYISEKLFFIFFIFFIFIFFLSFLLSLNNEKNIIIFFQKNWFFFISWYDYYFLLNIYQITDLNLIRELYFFNNSFEFFVINFSIFYGIFSAICLTFLIKKLFNLFSKSQLLNLNLINEINSFFFIRNQNFIKQQNTFAGTRVWKKSSFSKLNDN